jgi:HEAT repeat protein
VLVLLVVELLVVVLLVVLATRPLAIFTYSRNVRAAQEEYHKLYTPLTALTNVRTSSDTYSAAQTSPTVVVKEEQVSILDLVQKSMAHQMILGVPGAGKTMALRVYQYIASQHPWQILLRRSRIPVYVPMKNYSLFLKQQQHKAGSGKTIPLEDMSQVTLLDYLYESDLPGMLTLRPYLQQLAQQGRLLLLCDGLNEIDSNYLAHVDHELVHFMRDTRNRVVMTCREVDYREQDGFVKLVDEGQAARAVVYPLQPDQVCEFVERYVERQDKHWKHTAGQIMQVIDRSRLRYHCTNPMMLFTLMGIIDKIGVERGKQIDTRGRLLREYVRQLLLKEQQHPRWSKGAPREKEVVRFLSEVACAARWANDRNALQLRVSSTPVTTGSETRQLVNFDELADELQIWLDEHPALGPFATAEDAEPLYEPYADLPHVLQFALSTALIEVSPSGVLSFRHELIAEYFVAEYFYAADKKQRTSASQIREELLDNVGRWSEPVAIWAGLLDNPLDLAELFGVLGSSNSGDVLQALALSLVCVGVVWTPPQAEVQRIVVLPTHVAEALSIAVRNKAAREELARIFTRCAEEGGQEVYRSLLPLIMVDGVDELLVLLDKTIVPAILFTQLEDAVNNIAYEAQVKRLTQLLGRFGDVVIARAVELMQPVGESSVRLRAAAINVLGGTNDVRAVEPLIVRLSDTEPAIINRAATALTRLGPQLTLAALIRELENRTPGPFNVLIHRAVLSILGRFLEEKDPRRQVSMMQYQLILDKVIPVLTSNYQSEPEIQQLARTILVRQTRLTHATTESNDTRWEKIIDGLVTYLASQNDVAVQNAMQTLQEIGLTATPYLLEQLKEPSEQIRQRVVEIFCVTHDPRALPHLLNMVDDPAPAVQQQVVAALKAYEPESIPGLVQLVLTSPSETAAARAAHILGESGVQSIGPITNALAQIVPERTRLLVHVLETLHDPRAISALIALLEHTQEEPLLTIAVIRALSQFMHPQIVRPLLTVLSDPYPQVYEEAINTLSVLGVIALGDLIAALDSDEESVFVQRVQRAILGMNPFPGRQLIDALASCTENQAQQIMLILKKQGADAAHWLVRDLLRSDERVRAYTYQVLDEMPGAIVVPALLEVLNQAALRKTASALLFKYPDAAIAPLVELLGDHERSDAAASILPVFGPSILRPLVSGLDDQRSLARERAQSIIVTLVEQSDEKEAIVLDIVHLFNPTPPAQARDVLLEVLTNQLASFSIPALLLGLEDAHLLNESAEALFRLSQKGEWQTFVLDKLLDALYVEERRGGAETTLIRIGAPVVPFVGELIIDQNMFVARSARRILRDIGVPALSFIWAAYSDSNNVPLHNAALEVFYSMPTQVIKDELVSLLASDERSNIAMAVTLLLERIHDESLQQYADHVMVPQLLEYLQTHTHEATNMRIISLLLLLGEKMLLAPLLEVIEEKPQQSKQLSYILLLLGTQTQQQLLSLLNNPDTRPELRAELASILGLRGAPDVLTEYARNLSTYGLSSSKTSVSYPEQLTISLHALGALLASGQWNTVKLQEMRDASMEGTPAHELFNILLGWRYEPEVAKLENDLQAERDAHKKEVLALSAKVMMDQKRIQSLDEELEQIKQEHGDRGDELQQTQQEKDTLQRKIEQLVQERNTLRIQSERANHDNKSLRDQNEQLLWQLNQLTTAKHA